MGKPGVIQVRTDFGVIEFRGVDRGRPILLLITGTLASEDVMDRLWERFPALDVLRAHLPGNHCPPLVSTSVGVFAAAYDAAIARAFGERPVVVAGLSVGALVAFALRAPSVRAVLGIEPPLVMSEAWPLAMLRELAPPGYADFLWTVMGIGPETTEERDYRPLVARPGPPLIVLLGDPPPNVGDDLPAGTPGLVGARSREALRDSPRAEARFVPGVGHHLVRDAPVQVLTAICRALEVGLGPAYARPTLPPGQGPPPSWASLKALADA